MDRLWVIERQYGNEKWDICGNIENVCGFSTNYYEAQKNKRKIQKILQERYNKNWYKRCFRVSEYVIRY
jgi:hypothetical protein